MAELPFMVVFLPSTLLFLIDLLLILNEVRNAAVANIVAAAPPVTTMKQRLTVFMALSELRSQCEFLALLPHE
jgi:hypothetical protein